MPLIINFDLVNILDSLNSTFLYVIGLIYIILFFVDAILFLVDFAFNLYNTEIDDLREHYIE